HLSAAFARTPRHSTPRRLLRPAPPGPLPPLVLAGRLASRAPDITRMLDKLEQRAPLPLIERTRPPHDRRTVLVGITESGLALLDEIAGPLRDCHTRQLGHLPAADLQRLIALLKAARQPHEPDGSVWK